MYRRALTNTIGWTAAGALALGVANTYRFQTTTHRAALPGLTRPVRIAHLSDLHYGVFMRRRSVRRWVQATREASPDVIVVTGDFLDSGVGRRRHGKLLAELAQLHAPLGVYAVWGNHDWTSLNTNATRQQFAEQLTRVGVRLINNAGVQVRDDLFVAGVDDWWFGQQDLDAALRDHAGGAVVLLAHNPDYLSQVPAWVGLTLSGHTHGGQVRLPLMGPLKRRSTLLNVLRGWVRGDRVVQSPAEGTPGVTPGGQALGFVSRGLGVTGVPLRWDCPAELVLLDLHAPEDPGSGQVAITS
ncbi:metallophosphoesterase [Deinococcus soli (ex Cha et al. 2016)]|uniref:metallophosphoesterase n=1 Tax=Deinococcus soli (ex Cha et al. 2016) TaxID=1309411 RepID=UPI00166CE4F1|nr:metallophosphoesterase [Deinococcus soli (ex Cha et al. 2016)]GGB78955.1 putative metallophosphoesterase [Deinococcus soli (ex Cha et al. 2016)]